MVIDRGNLSVMRDYLNNVIVTRSASGPRLQMRLPMWIRGVKQGDAWDRIYLLEQATTQMKIPPKRKLAMHY
jgi:hypothetical protein